jgi:acetyl-CoA C-acetyltransferase
MKTAIVGWGHTRFGRLDEHDLESLIVAAAREAVVHAGLGFDDIDAIALGNLNAGLVPESYPRSRRARLFAPASRRCSLAATCTARPR